MADVSQLQIQFDAIADRLLLRIRSADKAEFCFALTRRCVKLLWPLLLRAIAANREVRRQADPLTKSAVISFQHQTAVSQSDFSQAYRDDACCWPLGRQPILVCRARLEPRPGLAGTLSLHPRQGRGIELALTEQLLHSLCKLLSESSRVAGWDLALDIAPPPDAAEGPPTLN